MEFLKYGPLKAVFALLSIVVLLPMALADAPLQAQRNIDLQTEHLAYLENEFYADYTPVDESKIANFDIDKAITEGVKLNEIAVIGTHNSYQTKSSEAFTRLYNALDVLTFGIVKGEKTTFNMDTLTEQFEVGLRSIEIDVEVVRKNGETTFTVCHDPMVDNTSTCYDYAKALEEIKLWSDNNPNHLPVSVLIEPKTITLPAYGLTNFTAEYAAEFDAVTREILGDSLLTPADVMGEYANLKSMCENDGWPALEDCLGKIIFILHPDTLTDSYVALDKTLRTQVMFPAVRYNERDADHAAFLLDNEPDEALRHEKETVERNFIVRTRADSFPNYSDNRYELIRKCRSQIISTDYPVRYGESDSHEFSFDGYTVKIVK